MFQYIVGLNDKAYSYSLDTFSGTKIFNKPTSKNPSKYNFHNPGQCSFTGIAQRYKAAEGF